MSYIYYGKKYLTKQEQYKRYQVMSSLLQYFPYLGHLPQLGDASRYSNQLLQDLYFQLAYVSENHFRTNPELGEAYNKIYIEHQKFRQFYSRQSELQLQQSRGDQNKPNTSVNRNIQKDEAKQVNIMFYKPVEDKKNIAFKTEQILETGKIKEELKKKGSDFVGRKSQEEKGLNQVQKDRKEIVFKLNLITPENLNDVEKNLAQFLYQNEEVCRVLVEQIIKKAWDQPKYASIYARLCFNFCKKPLSDFKIDFKLGKKQKDNPFKINLVESVQHSFDQSIEKFPIFKSPKDKQLFLEQFRKKFLSRVKFIVELIICKVLKKRIIKYCISQLLESFLKHYYDFIHDQQIEDSVYHYHYEAIIEFIDSLGENYANLDEKEKEKQYQPQYSYKQIQDHVQAILKITQAPNNHILDCIINLSGEKYFQLLAFINETYMKKAFPKLAASLQNLVERKNNKAQKHLIVTQLPKEVIQVKAEIQKQEHQGRVHQEKNVKGKLEQEILEKKVKQMYEEWEMAKNEDQKKLKEILQKYKEHDFYLALLKQVADEKKEKVAKRVNLILVVMNHPKFKVQEFKSAWINAIKVCFQAIQYLNYAGDEFPFCEGALARVLEHAIKKGGKLEQYHKKYEDEQQRLFSKQVIHKYYFYTRDEKALKFIKPKAKYNGLI